MLPDAFRRDGVIGRQIFGALARSCNGESGGTRPIDHLGNQRRLVAVGHGIDHVCLARPAGQQRTGQRVGFDIDHDDVLAGLECRKRVCDTRHRIAGCLDHDVDAFVRAGVLSIAGKTRAADAGRIPADGAARRIGAFGIEVGDHHDFETCDRRHLGQKHRAEFSGADQADTHRLVRFNAR